MDTAWLGRLQTAFAAQLPRFLPSQRWFGSKARQIQEVKLLDYIPIPLAETTALIAMVRVEYAEGAGETYVLPIVSAPGADTAAGIVRIATPGSAEEILFVDALHSAEFLERILDLVRKGGLARGASGELAATAEPMLAKFAGEPAAQLSPRLLGAEQSNTSILYGDRLILKFFRRLEKGINPDLEMGHFLTEAAHFPNIPPLCGSLLYKTEERESMTLGILQGFVPNRGDAWKFFTESLGEIFRAAGPSRSPDALRDPMPRELSSALLDLVELLGKRTGEMHGALASSRGDPAFDPEPFTAEFREGLEKSFHDLTVRNFDLLRHALADLPEPTSELAKGVLKREDDVLLAFHTALEGKISSLRTRIHGDYHLGQVLFTGSDFFIIDFEGEPAKPLSERRTKRSPVQDVAGMLRSFQYAVRTALLIAEKEGRISRQDEPAVRRLGQEWQARATERYLGAYRRVADAHEVLRAAPQEFGRLLALHLLEKAVYELGYELNNRPSWLGIPLGGIEETLAAMA